MSTTDLLRQTDIFGKLNQEELEAVARCVEERSAKADEILIQEGEPGDALFLIQDGQVRVEKTLGDRRVHLADLAGGAVFGEMSLLDNFPTSATVTAVEACRFLVIGRADLNVLLNWDTVLAAKMWRSFTEMLCYRVRSMNERLAARPTEAGTEELIATTHGLEAR